MDDIPSILSICSKRVCEIAWEWVWVVKGRVLLLHVNERMNECVLSAMLPVGSCIKCADDRQLYIRRPTTCTWHNNPGLIYSHLVCIFPSIHPSDMEKCKISLENGQKNVVKNVSFFNKFSEILVIKRPKYPSNWYMDIFPQNWNNFPPKAS